MTSPSGPTWSRKSASSGVEDDRVERRVDVGRVEAGGRRGSAPRSASQPPLTTIAIAFARMPTKAISPKPGQPPVRPAARRAAAPNASANSGSRTASTTRTSGLSAISVPNRTTTRREEQPEPAQARTSARLPMLPPARKPAIRPSATHRVARRWTRARVRRTAVRRVAAAAAVHRGRSRSPGSAGIRTTAWRSRDRRLVSPPGSARPRPTCVRDERVDHAGVELDAGELAQLGTAPARCVSGVIRYGRAAVIASNASATWRIRASFGISSPIRRSG